VRAELLLERGASYDNLIGKTPTNADAARGGWGTRDDGRRVRPATLPRATSFTSSPGELASELGKRMPFSKPKLDDALVDVVRHWVEAGAPADGWVSGTD
jgi:hypothetical protein